MTISTKHIIKHILLLLLMTTAGSVAAQTDTVVPSTTSYCQRDGIDLKMDIKASDSRIQTDEWSHKTVFDLYQ